MTAKPRVDRARRARRALGLAALTLLAASLLNASLLDASPLAASSAAAPQAALTDSETWGHWMQFFGRLHFALVHFPVGLLIAAGVIELCRAGRKGPRPGTATMVCLGLGWIGAGLAAYSGWTYSAIERHGHDPDGLLFWHRWGGIAVAVAAFLAWNLGFLARSGKRAWARTGFAFLLFVTTIGTGVIGHVGGSLMHGDEFLTEPFTDAEKARRAKQRLKEQEAADVGAAEITADVGDEDGDLESTGGALPVEGGPALPDEGVASGLTSGAEDAGLTGDGTTDGGVEDEPGVGTEPDEGSSLAGAGSGGAALIDTGQDEVSPAADEAAAYAAVQPILELTCYHCHGARKGKAGLRMHEVERLFESDSSEWVVVPGHPDKSELLRRISLPGEHEDVMPSDDDPLAPDEIALVAAWIESMNPEDHGLPADGGSAGSGILGDWAEVQGETGDSPPADDVVDPPVEDPPLDAGSADAESAAAGSEAADGALQAITARGAIANRIAADSSDVDVVFGLLRDGVTDEDLALLSGLEPVLVSLDLSRTSVTDAGLATLSSFKRLERLRLDNTGIGDDGVTHLRGLESLEYLNLYGTKVTDEGLGELTGLGSLRRLYLWQTSVTSEGVAALNAALPELEVVRDVSLPEPPPPLIVVEGETTFEAHAGPIFAAKCVECHGAEKPAAGLRYDSFDAIFAGTWAEWSIKPGDTELSRMLVAVRKEPGSKGAMPKKGDPLTAEELETLVAWVGGLSEQEDVPPEEPDDDSTNGE